MALHGRRGRRLAHHGAPRGPARDGARRAGAQRRRLPAHRPRPASRRRSSSAGCRRSRRGCRSRWPRSSRPSTRSPPARSTWWSATGARTRSAALRDALAPRPLVERTALPPETEIDDARADLPRPLFTAWLAARRRLGGGAAALQLGAGARRGAAGAAAAPVGRVGGRRLARRRARAGPGAARARPGRDPRALAGGPPAAGRRDRAPLPRPRARGRGGGRRSPTSCAAQRCGEVVTYVVNRNINYTNQCYFRCGFCGFSRGPKSLNLRGDPYILEVHEVVHRSVEAWERGATEVCLQGGIHPDFTGDFYVGVLEAIKARLPEMHVHGFTPLEVWQGAHTLGVSVRDFLTRLRDAGLGTLPGTAAEILDDRVRAHLCPDKVRTVGVGRGDDHRPRARPARHHHDDVRPHRRAAGLGQPPRGAAPHPAPHGRLHRVRAAALRPHGLADLPPGQGPAGADLGRGRAGPRGRAHRPGGPDRQHPGLLGEARPRRRARACWPPAATTSAAR